MQTGSKFTLSQLEKKEQKLIKRINKFKTKIDILSKDKAPSSIAKLNK